MGDSADGWALPKLLSPAQRKRLLAALPLRDPARAPRAVAAVERALGEYVALLEIGANGEGTTDEVRARRAAQAERIEALRSAADAVLTAASRLGPDAFALLAAETAPVISEPRVVRLAWECGSIAKALADVIAELRTTRRARRGPPKDWAGRVLASRLIGIWCSFTGLKPALPRGDRKKTPCVAFLDVVLSIAGAEIGGERALRDVRASARDAALMRAGKSPAYERAWRAEVDRSLAAINAALRRLRENAAENPEPAPGVDGSSARRPRKRAKPIRGACE